jgi:hypothetical protein
MKKRKEMKKIQFVDQGSHILDIESKKEKLKPVRSSGLHFEWQDFHKNQALVRLCFETILNELNIWTKQDYDEYMLDQRTKMDRNIERTQIIDAIKTSMNQLLIKQLNSTYQLKKKRKEIQDKTEEFKDDLKTILHKLKSGGVTEASINAFMLDPGVTELEIAFLHYLLDELLNTDEINIKQEMTKFIRQRITSLKKLYEEEKQRYEEEKEQKMILIDQDVKEHVLKELGDFEDINSEVNSLVESCYILAIEPDTPIQKSRKLSPDEIQKLEAYMLKRSYAGKTIRKEKLLGLRNETYE